MGWRSQEQHWHLKKKFPPKKEEEEGEESPRLPVPGGSKRKRYTDDVMIPEGLPDRFFNEEGEVDLRLVTGEEARKYFGSLGMDLPIMNTGRSLPMR